MTKKKKQKRKNYTPEFKEAAVRMVLEAGKTPAEVGSDLGVHATSIRYWVKQYQSTINRDGLTSLSSGEREELIRLRKENRTLQMERDILKKAAAFFAKESR